MSAGTLDPTDTQTRPPTRQEVALRMARFSYEVDPENTVAIYHLDAPGDADESPVRLLEVVRGAIPAGVLPIGFPPVPEAGYPYRRVLVEVTPDEFDRIRAGTLPLPHGWQIGEEIPAPGL